MEQMRTIVRAPKKLAFLLSFASDVSVMNFARSIASGGAFIYSA
jgi:hypothetical protein